jgi:thioredoxin-like negative regulator of GroEL
LLGFTPLMFSQSVIAEVYSLNAFFIALLLYLVLRYLEQPTDQRLYVIAFIFALGLTNHQSLLFLGFFLIAAVGAAGNRPLLKDGLFVLFAGMALFGVWHILQAEVPSPGWIWFTAWALLPLSALIYVGGLFTTWKPLLILALLSVLGLSLHLYMPLASAQNPPMDWGNTQTKEGFIHVITRGQYASFDLRDNVRTALTSMTDPELEPQFRDQLGTFLWDPKWKTSMASQFSLEIPLGSDDPTGFAPPPPEQTLPFALLGLIPLFAFTAFPKRIRNWFGSSIIAMFFLTVVFLLIQWPELQLHDLWVKRVQYIQAHVLFAIWMGLGVGIVAFLLYGLLPKRGTLLAASLLLCIALVAFPLWEEHNNPKHVEHLGTSRQNGHDFGWKFGLYQLEGTAGILKEQATQENPRPLPDPAYPPKMEPNAILFGGTDPGRFVTTYLVHSAKVRPDVKVLTQTALADSPYLETLREFYGDKIFIPDFLDSNRAFLAYANDLRLFDPAAFAEIMGSGNELAVSGFQQVNEINAHLTKLIIEKNAHAHSFYLEEAVQMPWIVRHLRPHGLIFKLEPEEVELTGQEIQQSQDFWDWMIGELLKPAADGRRNRYQRDLMARKLYSKLRMSQAWNLQERGHADEATAAMEQALRLYPANPEARLRAIDISIRQGNLSEAGDLLNSFAPHDTGSRSFAATEKALDTLKRLDGERVRLEAEYREHPSGNTALKLLQIYGSFEQRDKVEAMADDLLTMQGLHPDFYPALARIMQLRKNKAYYRKAVERWVEKDPRNATARIDLAVIALHEEDYTTMMRHLLMAVQLEPEQTRSQIAQDPRFLDIRHWKQFQRLFQSTQSR